MMLGGATRIMKTTFLLLSLCVLFSIPGFCKKSEKPPQNITEHYKWCGTAKTPAGIIARYEGFWSINHPGEVGYEDAIHARFVHLCAYRLAELYADTGNSKKCREMLKWLESEDSSIK